jgi:small subunit ribosomal protein S1
MVDVEKPEQNEMTDELHPTHSMEGGDLKADPEEKAKSDQKPVKKESANILDDEEKDYSDEEFEKFAQLYEQTFNEIQEGQIVRGRVLTITDNEVLVDIGFKSEGSVPREEFGDPPEVTVGDTVEVFLDTLEDSDGQLILSKRKATFMRLWDTVVDVYNENGVIDGTCVRRIKGGIVVDLMGVDAFLPGSQIDVKPIRDFDALIGQTYTFKVVKVNKLRKNIVVSRRALLEESMAEQKEKVLAQLEKGQICKGAVKNITDFGVFVDLGGVDGLLHINDISWGRINHPSEIVKLDAEIEVMILDFNDEKDRISLGLKQLQPHPWENIKDKYPEESVIKGKVVSITDYGAFVELEKGVEGLIHVSEMSWTRHGVHPSKMVTVGDMVDAKVLNIDKERKRISLGLKQLTDDPWEEIEQKFPIGTKYTGRVRNMTNFGAFVEMDEGIDGLIHISDLSWTRKIKHPSEVLKKSEEVEVVILDVNKKERRVSLGFKQISEDPWPAFENSYKVDTVTTGKVVRFVDKGLIIELPLGLEGFVPLSQMEETSMDQVSQKLKVGDEDTFVVTEFDRINKRVVLSKKKVKDAEAGKTDVDDYMAKQSAPPTLGEVTGLETPEEEKEPDKKSAKKSKSEKKPPEEKEKSTSKPKKSKAAVKPEDEVEADKEPSAEDAPVETETDEAPGSEEGTVADEVPVETAEEENAPESETEEEPPEEEAKPEDDGEEASQEDKDAEKKE